MRFDFAKSGPAGPVSSGKTNEMNLGLGGFGNAASANGSEYLLSLARLIN